MPVTTKAEDFRETFPKIGLTSLIESQFLSLEIESRKHLSHVTTIRVTGGASNNQGIVQIIADVFQAKVECIQVSNSAALGAAMRAAEATTDLDWPTLCSRFSGVKSSTAPRQEHAEIYKRKSDILSHNIKSFQAK
jgi:xylulokinase